jgi:hypothetical protein
MNFGKPKAETVASQEPPMQVAELRCDHGWANERGTAERIVDRERIAPRAVADADQPL